MSSRGSTVAIQKVASDPRPLSAVSPSAAYPTFESQSSSRNAPSWELTRDSDSNNATRQYPADVIQERAAL
ncbi:hypothetical protein VKT23_005098 [Stygiomarasmius scandens]